ncbi:uncharacterized protein KD926_003238 [Aspergillus affinis]|uniref:uncharacterized protein n=1 Tax=Aspergillus affinis TaxID=1070780 RepID=UPI0022FE1CC3|nr:uncharacterized protein KD926_003238 [Aspergillus affinis]KAI9035578.1 hypothetical protein KD926_003238 [Aspergillus affinis]
MRHSPNIQWVSIHAGPGPFESGCKRYEAAYENCSSTRLEDKDHSAAESERLFFQLHFRNQPMLRLETCKMYMEMILKMIFDPSERPGPLAFINGHPTFNDDGTRTRTGEKLNISFD